MPRSGQGQAGASRLPAEEIQAEIMAFADSYTAMISQAADRVTAQLPERAAAIHQIKLRNVQNAITIAAGANPIGGLLDMMVMVTLQRQAVEEHLIPEFGDAAQPFLEALQRLEGEIEAIAKRSLDQRQFEAMQALIPEIRERYRDQVQVSSIRASDFAQERRSTVVRIEGGGSLLQLFHLDPLAGLSPAAREIAQTRLLAERGFFWAKRLPLILNWQTQAVIMDALAQPATQQLIDATTRVGESAERLSAVAEGLSDRLSQERTALVDELAAHLAVEREAAIKQTFEHVAQEREAILRTFEQEDVRLRGLLEDLRQTADATTTLSASLTTMVETTERFTNGFRRTTPPDPDRRPFDIADYRATAETVTVTVAELNRLLVSLHELMVSPVWDERQTQLGAAADRAQGSFEALIDRSYRRGLVLVGVLIVGALAAALVYRLIAARLTRSGSR